MLRAGALVRSPWGVLVGQPCLGRRARHHDRRRAPADDITAIATQPPPKATSPPTSSIVVDANSGAVMQATNADSPRHPASLTKIMTLYLLFERLEAGKIKLTTEMQVSPHAAAQAPSKLGLKPGDSHRRSKPRSAPSSPSRPTTWR